MNNFSFAEFIIDYYIKKYCLTEEIYYCKGHGATIDWSDVV